RAGLAGPGLALGLVVAVLAFSGPLRTELFDGDALLVVALALGLAGYFLQHLVRGALSGTGRFTSYGLVLGADGALRLVACAALAGLGVHAAGPYGLAVGLAPLAAAGIGWLAPRDAAAPDRAGSRRGGGAAWSSSLSWVRPRLWLLRRSAPRRCACSSVESSGSAARISPTWLRAARSTCLP